MHYDRQTDTELHEAYMSDPFVKAISRSGTLEFHAFCKMLRNVFPKVTARDYKSVAGKCDICEKTRALMKTCKLRSDRLIIKRYRLLHRNKTMGEKLKYYSRIQEARESGGRVRSFVFDSMSKYKTKLPILQNMNQFSDTYDNNVMG